MHLTPEQNKIFDAYDRMFASDGWAMFIDEMKQNQESLTPQLLSFNAKMEDYYFLKGRNDVYSAVLGLQALMEAAKKNMEEHDE